MRLFREIKGILKSRKLVSRDSAEDFKSSCKKAQKWAKEEGFGIDDIKPLIKNVRSELHAKKL